MLTNPEFCSNAMRGHGDDNCGTRVFEMYERLQEGFERRYPWRGKVHSSNPMTV